MKKNIILNQNQMDKLLKSRQLNITNEIIEQDNKKDHNKNDLVSVLSENVFINKNDSNKNKINYKFSGFIFNVYKDKSGGFTRFIASIDAIQQHIEYYIAGTDNTIGEKKGFVETNIESDEIQPVRVLILDGEEYQVYDPKSKKAVGVVEIKEKSEPIENWLYSLSFYNPNSTFSNAFSMKKLNSEQVEELISVIKKSENIENQMKYLYIDYIRKQKNIKISNLHNLDQQVYKANPRIKKLIK